MPRINLTDSIQDVAVKMVEGNPGALHVLMTVIKSGAGIDPACAFGAMQPILSLDTLGIYGPRIWLLWKDICGQSPVLFVAVLRAWQLGFISADELSSAVTEARSRDNPIDVKKLYEQVRERLPDFAACPEMEANASL